MKIGRSAMVLSLSTALALLGPCLDEAAFASSAPLISSSAAGSCSAISSTTLAALIKTSISKPYISGVSGASNRCEYGVGPSAKKTGLALELAKASVVVDTISFNAKQQYIANTRPIVDEVIRPLKGVGMKAVYLYASSLSQAPAVYALDKNLFCSVELVLANSSEVGLPASTSAQVPPSQEAELAAKEGALCHDVFSHT